MVVAVAALTISGSIETRSVPRMWADSKKADAVAWSDHQGDSVLVISV